MNINLWLKSVAAKATTATTVCMPLECQVYQITTLSSIMPGGDLIQKFYKSIVAVDSILSSFLLHIFINAVFWSSLGADSYK